MDGVWEMDYAKELLKDLLVNYEVVSLDMVLYLVW
jgi:hypothetical protein